MGELSRGFVFLLLIVLISISLTSGLELSASTGGSGGSSSTNVVYGATVDDYANEHIGLSPGDGTLTNAFSGSGSLPYGSISKSDTKGNSVTAYRSINGKPSYTAWRYDWGTNSPTSSTAGSGVGAWLRLDVANAYSLSGGSYGSNSEGDYAKTLVSGNSPADFAGTSVNNMYTSTNAFTNDVSSSLSANLGTGASYIWFDTYSNNKEGDTLYQWTDAYGTANEPAMIFYPSISADTRKISAYAYGSADAAYGTTARIQGWSNNAANDYATATIYAPQGKIISPRSTTYASKTSDYVYPTASQISTPGTGYIYASSNSPGVSTNFKLYVTNGVINNPNFYAWSQPTISESRLVSLTSAYGATAEITSHAQNLALARDPTSGSKFNGGSADFKALNGNTFTNPTLDTTATGSLVTITPTGFPKTALLLEPFKAFGFGDLYSTVGTTLEKKGYAVTDYSNAGVTWDKVSKLDESTVSMIYTHGVVDSTTAKNPNTLGLAITYDPTGTGSGTWWKSWTQLQPDLKTPNGMILLTACDPFNTNSYTTTFSDGTKTTTPGKYTVSKAQVSGGYIGPAYYPTSVTYLNTFFTRLAAGDTVSVANTAAASSVGNVQKMTLQGNTAYKLP
jgi:hypothetical protein